MMRRLTETERAIEISMVWGISGDGVGEKDDVSWLSLLTRRRESVDMEEAGWRSGVPAAAVCWACWGVDGFLAMFRGKGIVWERWSFGCAVSRYAAAAWCW